MEVSLSTAPAEHNLLVVCSKCRSILYSAVSGHITRIVARDTALSHTNAYKAEIHITHIVENDKYVIKSFGEKENSAEKLTRPEFEVKPYFS